MGYILSILNCGYINDRINFDWIDMGHLIEIKKKKRIGKK